MLNPHPLPQVMRRQVREVPPVQAILTVEAVDYRLTVEAVAFTCVENPVNIAHLNVRLGSYSKL